MLASTRSQTFLSIINHFSLFDPLRFMMTFDESVNVSHWEWHEPSPGEFVRLTREQADQMPQLQRNTHIINGVPFNTVPF